MSHNKHITKMIFILFILLSSGIVLGSTNSKTNLNIPKIDKNEFADEFLNYYKTGVKTPYLMNVTSYLKLPREARMKLTILPYVLSTIDYIYNTGDVIDHGIWETSRKSNAESISKTYRALTESFPNIPIYPAIGNHEPSPLNHVESQARVYPPQYGLVEIHLSILAVQELPLSSTSYTLSYKPFSYINVACCIPHSKNVGSGYHNQFAPDYIENIDLSSSELYRLIANEWNDWLPSEARVTVEEGGYYTLLAQKGLRIIALNNNDCYTYNFWLLYNASYTAKQLQCLRDTLLTAEKNDKKVHILAHMPSGESSCFKIWAREYRRIVDRFWDTISSQFNGHTHKDEFNIYYTRDRPNYAINVAWNGGSVTPYSLVNPNYRIYTVETDVALFNDWIEERVIWEGLNANIPTPTTIMTEASGATEDDNYSSIIIYSNIHFTEFTWCLPFNSYRITIVQVV